jgi:hypothetical protein
MTSRFASCSCGQLSAATTTEPLGVSVCHCLACQRRSGSVFAAQARFPGGSVTLAGTSTSYVRVGDEGGRATFHFCPACGVTVYYTVDARPGDVIVPVGVFADPGFPAPTFSVYEERMHAWVGLPPGIEHMA